MPKPKGITLEERFWARTVKGKKCWKWTGSKDKYTRGRLLYQGKTLIAARVAYNLLVGSIPKGLCVCHKCDNPNCVNPKHLFTGTQKDNVRDSVSKGRNYVARGEDHNRAKLTESIVLECRKRHKPWCPKNGTKALAEEFGVTTDVMQKAIHRRMWKHI